MKKSRLLVALLLVTLCTGFSSCGKYLETAPEVVLTPDTLFNMTDKVFEEYIKDYSNITCRVVEASNNSIKLSGIKNKHLWFSEFDISTKNLKITWEDIEETDTIQQIYKGYGEYETLYIRYVLPAYYKKTNTGSIASISLSNGNNRNIQTIFTSNGKTKRTQLQVDYQKNEPANNWYNESVFLDDCCYSHEGDTIYIAKQKPNFNNGVIDAELISYEEGLIFSGNYMSKFNYKDAKYIWGVSITSPFDIPSNAKRSYTILNNSTNIWEYKVDVIFYDGTKKDFTFKINIDNGIVISDVTGITLNIAQKELELNEIFQLIATIHPNNATNKNIKWSSSNKDVATVTQSGLVTAKSIGETTITAMTEEGNFTASSVVTVKMKQDKYSIIGTWKRVSNNGMIATHVTYDSNGTFKYTSSNDASYSEIGKYKIVDTKLYEMFSDEPDWFMSEIILLNSITLTLQDLEDDGVTLDGKPYSYQRVE